MLDNPEKNQRSSIPGKVVQIALDEFYEDLTIILETEPTSELIFNK